MGYNAVSAGSIAQAQRVLASLDLPPDLILSDLHLGDGPDGIAAIEAVRACCGYDVAAILITGDTSHEEMRRATTAAIRCCSSRCSRAGSTRRARPRLRETPASGGRHLTPPETS